MVKFFGPSLKAQLLAQLDLQSRQAAEDRRAFREMLLEQVAMQEKMHAATVGLVESLAKSVGEQSSSFNRYLDLVTPKGETRVRPMTDAKEAAIERALVAGDETLGDDEPFVLTDAVVDQVALGDALADFVRQM